MFSWLGNIKTILIAVVGALLAGYAVTENIRRKQAESKLLRVERGIAQANVKLVQKQAEVKSETRDLEVQTQKTLIKDMKDARKVIEKEVKDTNKQVVKTQKINAAKDFGIDLSKLEETEIK